MCRQHNHDLSMIVAVTHQQHVNSGLWDIMDCNQIKHVAEKSLGSSTLYVHRYWNCKEKSVHENMNQSVYIFEDFCIGSFLFYMYLSLTFFLIIDFMQGRIQGEAHPARAPPKIGKKLIFWHKIVIFHTKYPKNFRASLRSAQFL